MNLTRRQRIAHLIEPSGSVAVQQIAATAFFLGAAFAVSAAYFVLTLPALDAETADLARLVYYSGGWIFIAEFLTRLWLAPHRDTDPTTMAWSSRRRYLASGLGIADLVSALPVVLILGGVASLDSIGGLALVSLCKVARYVTGIELLTKVIRNESRALGSLLLVVLILIVLSAALMYRLEHLAQPDSFSSVPATIWWAVVTIATVGYGDLAPITDAGRALGSFIIILGVATFAMPAGILASGFASEMRRRNFLITWQTVANVPLFADLSAAGISEITRLLRPEAIPANRVVVHQGDSADAMYFIMSGEVKVELSPQPIRLKQGQYFGEIALLKEIQRTATVITLADSQFLVLRKVDFRNLIDSSPRISARIASVAERRLKELEEGH